MAITTQYMVLMCIATTVINTHGAGLGTYMDPRKDNAPFEFVTFDQYNTPQATYRSAIKKKNLALIITPTPFPYKKIKKKMQYMMLEENSYTITQNMMIACGPNCPCIAIVATEESTNTIACLHCHYTTNHTDCAQVITNWFPSIAPSKLKILLYSVMMHPNEYNDTKSKICWLKLHNGKSQIEVIEDLAQTLVNANILQKNITISLIQEKTYPTLANTRFHRLSLMIDPASKNTTNPWGAYNTTINMQHTHAITTKRFSAYLPNTQNYIHTVSQGNHKYHFNVVSDMATIAQNPEYNSLYIVHAMQIQ